MFVSFMPSMSFVFCVFCVFYVFYVFCVFCVFCVFYVFCVFCVFVSFMSFVSFVSFMSYVSLCLLVNVHLMFLNITEKTTQEKLTQLQNLIIISEITTIFGFKNRLVNLIYQKIAHNLLNNWF